MKVREAVELLQKLDQEKDILVGLDGDKIGSLERVIIVGLDEIEAYLFDGKTLLEKVVTDPNKH